MDRARIVPRRLRGVAEAGRREQRLHRNLRQRPVPERQARLAVSASPASGLEWLLSFSDARRGVGWNTASRGGLEANLRRTRVLLDIAGARAREMVVVLVAGTNGKGSTAAMRA